MEAELLHADGRTDGKAGATKLVVAFRNFAKTPENWAGKIIIIIIIKQGC